MRGHGDPKVYAAARVFAALVLVPLFRYRCRGGDHLPLSGGVVVAVTHKSWGDPVLAGMACRRPLRFMAKAELFHSRVFGRLVRTFGAYPIRRGAADREALQVTLDILKSGGVVLMFPEGHRHHDEVVHDFLPGVGMLAMRAGVPVVPLAIRGTHRIVTSRPPFFSRVRVAMGPAVDLSGIEGRKSQAYAGAAERVRVAVQRLWDSL